MTTPMIIPMNTGGHGHLTPEGAKVLLGVWVVMNLVWFLFLLYGFIPAIKTRNENIAYNKLYKGKSETNILKLWYKEREWSMIAIFDILMLIFWSIGILFILGKAVSTLF